jgi:hypothetical protein
VIVRQREVDPLALMLTAGGSLAGAQAVTGDLLRQVGEMVPPVGFAVIASWVAIVVDGDAVDTVEWDPTTPIPTGALRLRCTAYSARTESEDAG